MNNQYSLKLITGHEIESISETYDVFSQLPSDVFQFSVPMLTQWLINVKEKRHLGEDIYKIFTSELPIDLIRKYILVELDESLHKQILKTTLQFEDLEINTDKIGNDVHTVNGNEEDNENEEDNTDLHPKQSWLSYQHIWVWINPNYPDEIKKLVENHEKTLWIAYVPHKHRDVDLPWIECVHFGPTNQITIPFDSGNLHISYKSDKQDKNTVTTDNSDI